MKESLQDDELLLQDTELLSLLQDTELLLLQDTELLFLQDTELLINEEMMETDVNDDDDDDDVESRRKESTEVFSNAIQDTDSDSDIPETTPTEVTKDNKTDSIKEVFFESTENILKVDKTITETISKSTDTVETLSAVTLCRSEDSEPILVTFWTINADHHHTLSKHPHEM